MITPPAARERSPTGHRVIGAGPSGLVAAATLAQAGRVVTVEEAAEEVGHRFRGDFQGLENWSTGQDVLAWLRTLGVPTDFEQRAYDEVTFYGPDLEPVIVKGGSGPLFRLVRRGPMEGSFDRALLAHALAAGAKVEFGSRATRARHGDIVATGPRFADGLVTGYVFSTKLDDGARCIISDRFAPAGYAYLLTWSGRATLATCLFRRHQDWRRCRDDMVAAFGAVVPGLPAELEDAEPFSGFGSVFPEARYMDEGGRLYVGEAAGVQDPEWGFGLRYAMESGVLAARCLVEGKDYGSAAVETFGPRIHAAFANRLIFEVLPESLVPALLRRGAASREIRERLRRHVRPSGSKSFVARLMVPRFARSRLRHRDLACHTTTCDCLWCRHGVRGAGEDLHAHAEDPDTGPPADRTVERPAEPEDQPGQRGEPEADP